MDQKVGFGHLFERGAKGGHQRRGQLLNKTHRVGEQRHMAIAQFDAPGGGVKRGKELVLGEHMGVAQRIE